MIILGIETSCDETSASVVKADKGDDKVVLLSNVVASSLPLHAKTGGIIPETAAREQVRYIIPVIDEALKEANLQTGYGQQTTVDARLSAISGSIDAISVTVGPGLIGSLLVGVETAKVFSYILNKPIIPVNHLFGHIYANWIETNNNKKIEFPVIALIVSGGHTDLVLMKNHRDIQWIGGTKDDAAGEAFDKIGRLLNLPYPGGPQIEKMANGVTKDNYNFPRPMIGSKDFDFSFSGLKSATVREIEKIGINNLNENSIKNISYSLQEAIFDVLISKTIKAAIKYNAKSIVLGGGVAANETLREYFELKIENLKLKINFFVPTKNLCTDNAAMIATSAFFNYNEAPWQKVNANPELYFD